MGVLDVHDGLGAGSGLYRDTLGRSVDGIRLRGGVTGMREIKFRAWDKENKEMVRVDFVGERIVHIENSEWEDIGPFEIMQFTGLYDKNGKEIYEGDIFVTRGFKTAVVEWEKEGRFLGFTIGGERRIMYIKREPKVEVIGNLYENPELLVGEGGDNRNA